MKCIRCNHDSKLKERTSRTCPSCKKAFAFEPTNGDPVTDMLFKNAIDAVSGNGRLRWGVEHLYYEICRRKRGKVIGLVPNGMAIAGGVFFLFGCFWTLTRAKSAGFPAIPLLFPFGLPIGAGLLFYGISMARNRFGSPFFRRGERAIASERQRVLSTRLSRISCMNVRDQRRSKMFAPAR